CGARREASGWMHPAQGRISDTASSGARDEFGSGERVGRGTGICGAICGRPDGGGRRGGARGRSRGVTAMADPAWVGWGYRLIEVGGVLTALILLLPRQAWLQPAWLGWAAGALLGAAPFLAYIASRTVGVPGNTDDVGNWGDWLGTVSLLVEAALVVLSVSMLLAARQRRGAAPSRGQRR